MCIICSSFNPFVPTCEYADLGAPTGTEIDTSVPLGAPGATTNESSDAAASVGTAYSVDVGTFFMGELATLGDRDWVSVDLVAGTTYTFALTGTGALEDGNDDPLLILRNASGTQVATDDDGGPGAYSSITFTATSTGTFYLDVGSYNNSDAGTYGLSAVEGSRASFNDAMAAGTLLRADQAWTATPGTGGAAVTWSIRSSGNSPDGEAFNPLNASQISVTQAAMAYVDAISGLTFTQVNPGGTSNNATIVVGAYDANDGSGAYAYLPGTAAGGIRTTGNNAGDIWLNNDAFNNNYNFGSYNYFTILHEIGHAIGLSHPGDYNAGGGGPISYANNAQYVQDSHQYTVMSYFDESNTGATGRSDYPDTFMLHDYLAIHALYGASTTYHAGATVYGFNSTLAGTVYDFTTNTTPFMTVYDGQGIDTIDLSGYSMAQNLSLVEGVMSNVGGTVGRFSIAYGAVIENAIGGSGADTLQGNDVSNMLDGGEGNDSLNGGIGNDTLMGGAGDDELIGGAGFDMLIGGEGNDTIFGELGNDRLMGGGGRDILRGGNRDDVLMGEQGNDRLYGGSGNDTLDGGDRNDLLIGGTDEDVLLGATGNDTLSGGAQSDYLDGGADDDYLVGGGGFDTLVGGEGDDLLVGGFNADTFVFADNHGDDIIVDFAATNAFERIDFSGLSTLNSLSDVLGTGSGTAATTQVGANVVIDTGSGTILLQNVLYSDLDATDFVF